MTSHLARVPIPDGLELSGHQNGASGPPLMAFFIEAIKLYDILDNILADVYNLWRGRLRQGNIQSPTLSLASLQIVLEVERELLLFKANIPSFLKWTAETHTTPSRPEPNTAIAQQRNVLHARYVAHRYSLGCYLLTSLFRYIHLQILLYRPIFTQIYSKRGSSSVPELQKDSSPQRIEMGSNLYSSIFSKCAEACVTAAIDLTHLVRKTYQTDCSDAWWYNGFCKLQRLFVSLPIILILPLPDISTAAMVLLMAISTPSMMDQVLLDKAREAWKEATGVLEFLSTFCRSATNTLQFLQAAYLRAVPTGQHQTRGESDASHTPQPNYQSDNVTNDLNQFPILDWEDFAENMAPGLDDLGFLTGFNFYDTFA